MGVIAKRMGSWGRVLAVNGLILLGGLVVLELIFGGWLRPGGLNVVGVPKDVRWSLPSGKVYGAPGSSIIYTRDRYGLRGRFGEPANVALVTIGGSTTDQRFIADGATWQDVLATCLARNVRPMAIANAGVDGQSTFGHIENFRSWFPHIPGFKPKYYLFYVGLNDFHRDAGDKMDTLTAGKWEGGVRAVLKKNSATWLLLRRLRGWFRAAVEKRIDHGHIDFARVLWTEKGREQSVAATMAPRLAAYERRLGELMEQVAGRQGQAICVSQPARFYRKVSGTYEGVSNAPFYDGASYNGIDFRNMMRMLDGVTQRVCESRGGWYLDLAASDGWEDGDFYDFIHMTPSGARKVGEQMCAMLTPYLAGTGR